MLREGRRGVQPWERPLALHGKKVLAVIQYTLLHW